jgi:hypothetical protein
MKGNEAPQPTEAPTSSCCGRAAKIGARLVGRGRRLSPPPIAVIRRSLASSRMRSSDRCSHAARGHDTCRRGRATHRRCAVRPSGDAVPHPRRRTRKKPRRRHGPRGRASRRPSRRTRRDRSRPRVRASPLWNAARIPRARSHCRGSSPRSNGSGTSRFSPRNRFVADRLRQAGLGAAA